MSQGPYTLTRDGTLVTWDREHVCPTGGRETKGLDGLSGEETPAFMETSRTFHDAIVKS